MNRRLYNTIWLNRILLMIMIAPFALLWSEIFTRVLLPQNVDSRMNIFEPDSVIGFTYKPGAQTFEKGQEYNVLYQINSLGLRDREYGEKKDGVFRVLLLGDSFSVSHGLQMEESLSRQMENALQAVTDLDGRADKIEVINAAAGGYSPYNYWKAYHRWAPIFKPDAVIIGLSPDDYECNNENVRYLIENGATMSVLAEGQVPENGRSISLKKVRKWLSWNSEFYILMRNFFYYNDLVRRIFLWKNPGGIENDSQLQLFMVSEKAKIYQAWSKSYSYLTKLKKATATDGVAMVLISIPLKMEIDPEQYQQVLVTKGLKKDQIDLDQQLRQISDYCKKENIFLLDPRPDMRAHHANKPCYFVLDGHWNAVGVSVAAGSLARQWRDLAIHPWNRASARVRSRK